MSGAFVLGESLVKRCLPMVDCIEHTQKALQLVQSMDLLNPVRHGVVLPLEGKEGVHILGFMPCYLAGTTTGSGDWWKGGPVGAEIKMGRGGYICSKVITVFPSNVGSGFSGHQGVVLLYSAENGSLLSIADAHEITGTRTAAASAVATRLLAKDGPCVLAIIGSGFQAVKHVEAMRAVREIVAVRIWSRTRSRAEALAQSLGDGATVHDTAEDAVREADIVCTLTPSPEPVLQHAWLRPGSHVNAVGSCHPQQRELDEDCVTRAQLFCDSREACLQGLTRTGDLVIPVEKGSLSADSIVEIGTVLASGAAWARQSPEDITVFKSVGIAVEDLCSAVALYENISKEPEGSVARM